MAEIYEERIECELCNKTGWIQIFNFNHVSIQNRLQWNKESRIVNLKQDRICPLCEGKSYLYIIKQKTF